MKNILLRSSILVENEIHYTTVYRFWNASIVELSNGKLRTTSHRSLLIIHWFIVWRFHIYEQKFYSLKNLRRKVSNNLNFIHIRGILYWKKIIFVGIQINWWNVHLFRDYGVYTFFYWPHVYERYNSTICQDCTNAN